MLWLEELICDSDGKHGVLAAVFAIVQVGQEQNLVETESMVNNNTCIDGSINPLHLLHLHDR